MSLWMAFLVAMAAAAGGTNFFQLTPKQFSESQEAKQEIRFEAVNSELLSAAVLHETNRRRVEKKLPALKHHPKAQQAAEIQSQIMKKRGSISHDNPENPRYATLPKRVNSVGVNPGFAAENVATALRLGCNINPVVASTNVSRRGKRFSVTCRMARRFGRTRMKVSLGRWWRLG
jgi:hypothetical protein